MSQRATFCRNTDVAVYIPKNTGAVRSIFKNGRVSYEGYAEPSQLVHP
jgi:hypothetical protein